ncbi:MAG: hypothetical protein L0Y56_15665, partial [Nitrospira sp.]|nr:hypothetical protein [Nitrospira sp.]
PPLMSYDAGNLIGQGALAESPSEAAIKIGGGAGLLAASAIPGVMVARGVARGAAREAPGMIRAAKEKGAGLTETRLLDPPLKPQRPFAADYPQGVRDPQGELMGSFLPTDMEGRPLTATYIAGRHWVGGPDIPIPPTEYNKIAKLAIGREPEAVSAKDLPKNVSGSFRTVKYRDRPNPEYYIYYKSSLSPDATRKVKLHETSHMIDKLAGEIPTKGLHDELEKLYSTLAKRKEGTHHLTLPVHHKYTGEHIEREYIAEAIRAYLENPNYIKTVAPKTAARIREYVNKHPRLSKIIQFNVAPPLALGTTGAMNLLASEEEQ